MQSLPRELYFCIFSYLPSHDWITCMKVCKDWNSCKTGEILRERKDSLVFNIPGTTPYALKIQKHHVQGKSILIIAPRSGGKTVLAQKLIDKIGLQPTEVKKLDWNVVDISHVSISDYQCLVLDEVIHRINNPGEVIAEVKRQNKTLIATVCNSCTRAVCGDFDIILMRGAYVSLNSSLLFKTWVWLPREELQSALQYVTRHRYSFLGLAEGKSTLYYIEDTYTNKRKKPESSETVELVLPSIEE